jgi:hypothetical protein
MILSSKSFLCFIRNLLKCWTESRGVQKEKLKKRKGEKEMKEQIVDRLSYVLYCCCSVANGQTVANTSSELKNHQLNTQLAA